jgi:peroxiredoxin
VLLLRDRSHDLADAGILPLAISRDSPWSHAAWSRTLGVEVVLLSDWNGDAARGFDVAFESRGMRDVAARASFLVENGSVVRASWMHGSELPDIDAVIAAARTSATA